MSRNKAVFTGIFVCLWVSLSQQANAIEIGDWGGYFRGFIDGRPATLQIGGPIHADCNDSVTNDRNPTGQLIFNIRLTDVDRNAVWSRNCITVFSDRGPNRVNKHIWQDLRLRNENTGQIENVGTYYLLTWDKDFITGVNEVGGRKFGRFFIRNTRQLPACTAQQVIDKQCRYR